MEPRNLVAAYLLLPAFGIQAWWVLLFGHLPRVKWFQPAGWLAASFFALAG